MAPLRRTTRHARLAVLLMAGLLVTVLTVWWCSTRARLALKASWSAALLDALGITVEADLEAVVPGSLLVANHISWLDIFVINAVLPAAFVAKAEVRHWPLIGWLAARHDTVFLRRGSRGHARLINAEIGAVLGRGGYVAVFPEGTTTDGTHVLHFHAALLQPALDAGRPVVPLALSYWEADGTRSLAPRYDGSITLGQCLRAVASRPRLTARLVVLPALGQAGADRRSVAQQARASILSGAGLTVPDERLLALRSTPPCDENPRAVQSVFSGTASSAAQGT